ncbi:MAG: NADPH-dependent FMN reductase [Bacteroidota bacterium]|jgi:chromate reductase
MITIINATNRGDNLTRIVGNHYASVLEGLGIPCKQFGLNELPIGIINQDYGTPGPELLSLAQEFIIPVPKLVIISPEYNGSIPGILKLFIDSLKPEHFKNKRAALVGVASGRAGNLRGLDHLTAILHHLGVEVLSKRAYVSHVHKGVTDGVLTDPEAIRSMAAQAEKFIAF